MENTMTETVYPLISIACGLIFGLLALASVLGHISRRATEIEILEELRKHLTE